MLGLCLTDVQQQPLTDMLRTMGCEVQCFTELPAEPTALDLLVVDAKVALGGSYPYPWTRNVPMVAVGGPDTASAAMQAVRHGIVDYLPAGRELEQIASVCFDWSKRFTQQKVVAAAASSLELLALATKVAATDVAVMLHGESGTGKEVIARALHERSRRSSKPYVAVNCAAIPENMLEAMLFGHEKGAFTGALERREGKFEQANNGTLLLDEVTEMALPLQAKLLRALQEREIERVGGRKPIQVDTRVIATSNRDLREEVAAGRFREDLYYRLNVFPLHVAPLRERLDDIEPLARHFIVKHARLNVATGVFDLSDDALQLLRAHAWPGNVRELENTIQRALVLARSPVLSSQDIDLEMAAVDQEAQGLSQKILIAEGETILAALNANGGHRQKTAKSLGISERTLRYKIAKMRDLGVNL